MRFDAEVPPTGPLHPLQVRAPDIGRWIARKDDVRGIGHWRELGPEEYARAFTAAQTAGTSVADDLFAALVDTFGRQGTEADFRALVIPALKAKGWLGGDDGEIARRVELIYDTNLRLARAAGRWTHYQASKDALPYLRAFTVGDERVRHPPQSPHSDHRAWDGIVLPAEHPFWTRYWPPLGFRCRCEVVQMSRSQFARLKGGVTTEADLADRIRRLGDPVFLAPAAPIGGQLRQMVEAINKRDGSRMPGLPVVDPAETEARGRTLWQAVREAESLDTLGAHLRSLGFRLDREGNVAGGPIRTTAPVARPAPPAPPPPPPVELPREFRSPVRADVTDATIKVEPRLAVQKRLRAEFAKAAKHPAYDGPQDRWSGRTVADHGTAKFDGEFTDKAVSAIGAIKRELDDLAEQIGIPPLRGFKSMKSATSYGNQGDGVMALNPRNFNSWASRVGRAPEPVDVGALRQQRREVARELEPLAEKLRQLDERRRDIGLTLDERVAAHADLDAVLAEMSKLRARDADLFRKVREAEREPAAPVGWKQGDDPAKRPGWVGRYMADGLDQIRTALFHEFGHHVHQYLNKAGPRARWTGSRWEKNLPPLERELAAAWRTVNRGQVPSTYGASNEHEWFAESFAAFVMGRADVLEPTARALIERIFRRAF